MRNKRGGSSSSSKGKKSNSEKPKPARRGLGVDQLEKIVHGQMGSPYGHYPGDFNHMEYDQSIIYGDSLLKTTTSWNTRNVIMDGQYFAQPNKTRQLLNLLDSRPTESKQRSNSPGSSRKNSESGGAREPDLELRLSL